MLAYHHATAIEFFGAHIVEVGSAMDGSEAIGFGHKQWFGGPRQHALCAGEDQTRVIAASAIASAIAGAFPQYS